MVTMAEVRRANPIYFGKGQKKFFNDIGYKVRTSSDGFKYLLTETYGFTDMFGADRRRKFYHLKDINEETLEIDGKMREFATLEEVNEWLRR